MDTLTGDACQGSSVKWCGAFSTSVQTVWNAFVANATHLGLKPSSTEIAKHVIGYVPFGDGKDWTGITPDIGAIWIALAAGVPSQDPMYNQYKYPDYDSPYNLDPYVTFIHKTYGTGTNSYNLFNVYAFSIDDSIGYFDVPEQNTITIAINGLHGLLNKAFAVKPVSSSYHANFGPGWTQVEGCGNSKQTLDPNQGPSVPLTFDASNRCTITFSGPQSTWGNVKLALANQQISLDSMGAGAQSCTDSAQGTVCQGIYVNPNTHKDLQGPGAPSGGGGGGGGSVNAEIYLPAGWNAISSAD